jgi:hypothetical protein
MAHVRPSRPSTALEIMYGVPPLDLFIHNYAQNAAIRVKPDTSWQPPAKDRARVAHGRHLHHQFLAGLWQADTDEINYEKVWEKNYTVQIPTKEIDMLPSGDIDAYTDGSLMGGKSGAGVRTVLTRAIAYTRFQPDFYSATVYFIIQSGSASCCTELLLYRVTHHSTPKQFRSLINSSLIVGIRVLFRPSRSLRLSGQTWSQTWVKNPTPESESSRQRLQTISTFGPDCRQRHFITHFNLLHVREKRQ